MDLLWELLKRKVSDSDGTRLGQQPPWYAKSVIVAALTSIAGIFTWLNGYSTALILIGGSYLGGFFLGWMFRRFVKTASLITGAFILLIGTLKGTGLITLDWAAIEYSANHSLLSFKESSEGIKHALMSYLPSAGTGSAGIFFGFKKK